MAKTKTELQQEEKIPTPVDVEWTDWVLGQLDSTELDDGAPKVSGLRRMCEKLIGEIVETDLCTVQIPTNDNLLRATVEVTIVIDRHDGKRVKYKDVSDACSKNADPPFNQYPPALAQTRAFGRCLRQALKLNVVTAEEKSDNADYSAEVDTSSGPRSIPCCIPRSMPCCIPRSMPCCIPRSIPCCIPRSMKRHPTRIR